MDEIQILRLVHIVSSTVLFGTGLGTAFHMWLAHRSGDVRAIAVATRSTVIADWLFTTPAVMMQPLSGIGLIWLAGHDPFASWLVVSYFLYLVAGACWVPVVYLQLRMRDIVAGAANDAPLPASFDRHMRLWFILGWPAFLSVIAIFALMVAKPALW